MQILYDIIAMRVRQKVISARQKYCNAGYIHFPLFVAREQNIQTDLPTFISQNM